MEGIDESFTMGQPVVDNIVQHATEQTVERFHEFTTTTLQPPVVMVSEVVSTTTLEPMVSTMVEEVITEASTVLVDEVASQVANVVVESSSPSFGDTVSTIVENVVQPVLSDLPIPPPPEVVQQVPVFVESETVTAEAITERVTEFVTEATQEFTTLLSPASDDHVGGGGETVGDRLLPKALMNNEYVQWLHETRLVLAISVSMVYLFIIFFIRRLLTKRSPFHLRNLLTLWNIGFSVFSVACSAILTRHLVHWTKENGLGSAICSAPINDSIRLWLSLFTWSKLLELGNTLFVVLRKQKLRFIHVYYHLSTLIYVFYLFGGGIIASGDDASTPAYYPVVILINAKVQGIIYAYYIFRSRGCAPARLITMVLNLIHIIQFIAILFILTLSMYHHLSPSHPIITTLSSSQLAASLSKHLTLPPSLTSLTTFTSYCSPSISTDIFGITVIGTNFILFVKHFRSNYVKPKTIKLL